LLFLWVWALSRPMIHWQRGRHDVTGTCDQFVLSLRLCS
jgi:hypothetical protein